MPPLLPAFLTYDNRNRLKSKATPQGTLTYTYDDAGNLLTTRSSNTNGVSVDYTYDTLNRENSHVKLTPSDR